MNLLSLLQWRYATKKYSNDKISDEKIANILAATNLTASSFGLQPYKIIVVEDEEIRNKLRAYSFNAQVTEASHLLVFAAFETINRTIIDQYVEVIAKQRHIAIENLSFFKEKLLSGLLNQSVAENFLWASKQIYIALGTALIAAAAEQVDSTPMEGFDSSAFDDILGLKEMGLKSVVLLALGYRDTIIDSNASLKKVRWPLEDFIVRS